MPLKSVPSSQHRSTTAKTKLTGTVHLTLARQHVQFSEMLLGDMSLLSGDVDPRSRPQPRQPLGFSCCSPAPLARHASMPGRPPLPSALFQPPKTHQHQQPLPLARHHSHTHTHTHSLSSFGVHLQDQQQQPQGFQSLLTGSMMSPISRSPPPVHEMQYLLEISMDQQQPLQFQAERRIKSEPTPSSPSSMHVEPIAFSSVEEQQRSTKMALEDFDPLAFAVFGSITGTTAAAAATLKPGQLVAAVPPGMQQLESAFDSLDRLLPEAEQDLMFRLPELERLAEQAAAGFGSFETTSSSSSSSSKCVKGVFSTCKVTDCDRRVRSRGFCKTHGGGRKCSIDGCNKSSQNGDFCIGHGGGKKCKEDGCAKAAQSHGLCKAHGGGARCKFPTCNKSSQGGGLCRAHGGGKRCQAAGCLKGAQRGNFCATHGGFRNCKIESCVRTDRGGGFCEVHRRGRLCKVDGCKKLSRNQGMCTMHIREDKQVVMDPVSHHS